MSPDSILRLIFSLSLSCRSGSSPGVEHLELELSLLLLPSKRGVGPPFPLGSSTMAGFLLTEGGAESLGLLTSEDRIPREGQRCLPGRILGFGWSISASLDPEWVGENLKSLA